VITIWILGNIDYNYFFNFGGLHISDFDQIMVCKKGIKGGYKVVMSQGLACFIHGCHG
jgi:hypothetical protein